MLHLVYRIILLQSKKKTTKAAKVRAQAKAKDKEPVATERTMKEVK